jgi:hypothetical protein
VRCFVCRFIKKIIARVIDPLVASSSLDGAFLPQIAPWSTRAFNRDIFRIPWFRK